VTHSSSNWGFTNDNHLYWPNLKKIAFSLVPSSHSLYARLNIPSLWVSYRLTIIVFFSSILDMFLFKTLARFLELPFFLSDPTVKLLILQVHLLCRLHSLCLRRWIFPPRVASVLIYAEETQCFKTRASKPQPFSKLAPLLSV